MEIFLASAVFYLSIWKQGDRINPGAGAGAGAGFARIKPESGAGVGDS